MDLGHSTTGDRTARQCRDQPNPGAESGNRQPYKGGGCRLPCSIQQPARKRGNNPATPLAGFGKGVGIGRGWEACKESFRMPLEQVNAADRLPSMRGKNKPSHRGSGLVFGLPRIRDIEWQTDFLQPAYHPSKGTA